MALNKGMATSRQPLGSSHRSRVSWCRVKRWFSGRIIINLSLSLSPRYMYTFIYLYVHQLHNLVEKNSRPCRSQLSKPHMGLAAQLPNAKLIIAFRAMSITLENPARLEILLVRYEIVQDWVYRGDGLSLGLQNSGASNYSGAFIP